MGVKARGDDRASPIAVKRSRRHGRGVFATRPIRAGQLIEEAPVVVVPPRELASLKRTVLKEYGFLWGEDERAAAMMLSVCSLCNHSYRPNATFDRRFASGTIAFVALRDIAAGQEITINYNGDPASRGRLWFSVRR